MRGVTAMTSETISNVNDRDVTFSTDFRVTSLGNLIFLKTTPCIMIQLSVVMLKRESCDPTVLMTPSIMQGVPVNHSG